MIHCGAQKSSRRHHNFMIRTIQIICKPCHKCELMKQRIKFLIQCLEFKHHIKIKYALEHIKDIRKAEDYGLNITQLPLTLINGEVAFAGHVKGDHIVRMKLEEFMRRD